MMQTLDLGNEVGMGIITDSDQEVVLGKNWAFTQILTQSEVRGKEKRL